MRAKGSTEGSRVFLTKIGIYKIFFVHKFHHPLHGAAIVRFNVSVMPSDDVFVVRMLCGWYPSIRFFCNIVGEKVKKATRSHVWRWYR